MEIKPELEDILLRECTDEELTYAERAVLEAWLNENHKNQKVLAQLKMSFLNPKAQRREQLQEEVWTDLQTRLKSNKRADTPTPTIRHPWLKAAVIILICTTLGILTYQLTTSGGLHNLDATELTMVEKVCLPGQKITTTLPDGTVVKLNADSKIIVPDQFSNDMREVTLYGEAFFEVAKDKTRPFIISTKDIQVEVLGTSFNVKSYPDDNLSVVAVATGKVAVSDGLNRLNIIPGEKVSYKSDMRTMTRENFDWEKEYGWKENILLFQGENFSQIEDKLSKWYGVTFTIEGNQLDYTQQFSGRYVDQSLSSVLDGLSYLYGFNYQINNRQVILSLNQNKKYGN